MATLSTVFYVLAGVIGLVLLATRGSTALLVIGVVGFVVSLGYTAPPLKFVYRGLGEVAVALGFGPLMLLGAYVVQTRRHARRGSRSSRRSRSRCSWR